jgi:hypothetical protein
MAMHGQFELGKQHLAVDRRTNFVQVTVEDKKFK